MFYKGSARLQFLRSDPISVRQFLHLVLLEIYFG